MYLIQGGRLFVCVAYVGSLLKKNEAYTVCRMLVFSCDLKSDLCLKNEACTGCRALVCSHGLC